MNVVLFSSQIDPLGVLAGSAARLGIPVDDYNPRLGLIAVHIIKKFSEPSSGMRFAYAQRIIKGKECFSRDSNKPFPI
jgi:hypothetical protein